MGCCLLAILSGWPAACKAHTSLNTGLKQRALPSASVKTAGASRSVPFSVAVLTTVKAAVASSHCHSCSGKGARGPLGPLCRFTNPLNHKVQGHLCRNTGLFSPSSRPVLYLFPLSASITASRAPSRKPPFQLTFFCSQGILLLYLKAFISVRDYTFCTPGL